MVIPGLAVCGVTVVSQAPVASQRLSQRSRLIYAALPRVYHERHWVNDVLGGAAVGILSAQAAYWLLPAERRLFGLENKDLSLLAVPYTDGRSTGLSLAMRF